MKAGSTKVVRCAIYTRVSTDQGLEQDFNSLDAQDDASQAYIRRPRRHQTTAGTHDDPDYRPVQLFNDQTPSIAWARKLPPMLHLETRGRAMRRSAPFSRIRSRARPTGVIPRARARSGSSGSIASIAYMDPGNFATNIQAGA